MLINMDGQHGLVYFLSHRRRSEENGKEYQVALEVMSTNRYQILISILSLIYCDIVLLP